MRRRITVLFLSTAFFTAVAAACGSSSSREAITDKVGTEGEDIEAGPSFVGDAATTPPCEGLACKQVACPTGTTTSVSGRVWDPAGKNPVYNAVVYVPNAPLDPIKHGPVCDSCGGAPLSGKPLVTTLSDPTGAFTLENVPVDDDVPIVIQIGKWRRQFTLRVKPEACADTVIDDTLTRLPKDKMEGDMPLIALTSGCDPIHTLMQKIGIDRSEFTTASGNGMVHVYAGSGGAQSTGVIGASDAYEFWGSLSEMMKYDIIINECECTPLPRDTRGPAYENMRLYLNAGGRVFNSHYHLNFFGSSPENQGKAAQELQSAARWSLWGSGGVGGSRFLIDTTFPKGKAMDEWLMSLPVNGKWGPNVKKSPKGEILTSNVGDIAGTVPGLSQRWIYSANGSESPVYISINTPTTAPADERCGRAVATDIHVGNGSLTEMIEQEAALEFMFFDLASCVIDDAKPPKPPEPK